MRTKALAIAAILAFSLIVFSGCSSPQKDAEKQYKDTVSISLFGVENGIAYYDVVVSKSFGWDTAGPTRQVTIAKLAVDDCESLFTSKTDFPLGADASSFEIMALVEGTGAAAFQWNGGDSVKIYTEEGRQNKEYNFSDLVE